MDLKAEEIRRIKAMNPYSQDNIPDEAAVSQAIHLLQGFADECVEEAAQDGLEAAQKQADEETLDMGCFHPEWTPEQKADFRAALKACLEEYDETVKESLKERLNECPWLEDRSLLVDALDDAREEAYDQWLADSEDPDPATPEGGR